MIRAVVVEDSPTVRELLIHILRSAGFEIVGVAADGEEAVRAVERFRPDVVAMDIHMPKMDGVEATRRIMETHPTPIVIVSGSSDPDELEVSFITLEAGALAVIPRPAGIDHPGHASTAANLVNTVRLMSEVRVVRRWPRNPSQTGSMPRGVPVGWNGDAELVAIGASTGGPPILHTILAGLPATFPLPILIVQHMTSGFTGGLAEWLNRSSSLAVHVATDEQAILPGHVYIAPDEFHMEVDCSANIRLSTKELEHGTRPSVSTLFRSVHDAYGGRIVAGLLSGMGRDGAAELKLLRDAGAATFVQDQDSSVVYGMPGEAIRLHAASAVLSPDQIIEALNNAAHRRTRT